MVKYIENFTDSFSNLMFLKPDEGSFYMITGEESVKIWKFQNDEREDDIRNICSDDIPAIELDKVNEI